MLFVTPAQTLHIAQGALLGLGGAVDALIRREVSAIGTPDGGLAMIFGLYPGTPLENVEALMDAMERYAGYFR